MSQVARSFCAQQGSKGPGFRETPAEEIARSIMRVGPRACYLRVQDNRLRLNGELYPL